MRKKVPRSILFNLKTCHCLNSGHLVTRFVVFILFTFIFTGTVGTSYAAPARAQQNSSKETTYKAEIFELTNKLMTHPILYKYLNTVFKDHLKIPVELQKQYNWPAQSKGLSSTQVMYILNSNPILVPVLEKYLGMVNMAHAQDPDVVIFRETIKKQFEEMMNDPEFSEQMKKMTNPTEPLVMTERNGKPGYTSAKLYVNHPSLSDPEDPKSRLIPADDLRQLVIDFIHGAQKSIHYNVFEFDLDPIADALIEANQQRGVTVLGGIDNGTIDLKPKNQEIFKKLDAAKSSTMTTVRVDSVGLNHQKILVRDAGTPNASVLFLSGNFTQSCIGPEGDAINIPADLRPQHSKPNANHALLIKGTVPALVAKYELEKTLINQLRGEKQYPISGSYLVKGPIGKDGIQNELMIAFSPNGGMGEVNRDILVRLIINSKGPLWMMHFAFSSPQVMNAIKEKFTTSIKSEIPVDLRAVGDPPFAMREWSNLLELSALQRDETTKVYSDKKDSFWNNLVSPEELIKIQDKLRVNPKVFGEFHDKLSDGTDVETTVKLHHKVFIFPTEQLSVVGTSFNPSANAETNQEQLITIRDPEITKRISGAFLYLHTRSPYSMKEYAEIKNKFKVEDPILRGKEADFIEKSNKKNPSCEGIFR